MGKDKHKEKHSVEFKAVMPLEKVKNYLLDLLAGMDEGSICVESGEACAVLQPKEMVKVEVEAKEKKDKSKFSLKLTWENEMVVKGDSSALTISSKKPEPVEAEPESAEPVHASAEDEAAEDEICDDEKSECCCHGE